ncbi:MAG: hypothetical protein RBU37_04360 [Myxococcota bacterium]|jgi:hypothetical protein|nr:hypothetical protein [Myxococcota bacterium]
MLLRSHGHAHFALTRGALFEFDADGVRRVRELPETEAHSALSPSGRVVWQFPELRRIECADMSVQSFPLTLNELLPLDDDVVAAVRLEEGRTQRASLVLGRPPTRPDETWALELPLQSRAELRRVDWPDELIWASKEELPWVRNQSFVPRGYQNFERPIRLAVSPWGIGVVGVYSGLVTCYRHGEKTLDPFWRLPTQEDVSIDVWPTPDGFCCTYVVEGRDAAIILFDREGKVRAELQGWGMLPAMPLGERFIVSWDDDADELLLLDRKDLSEYARVLEARRPTAIAVCEQPPSLALLGSTLVLYEVQETAVRALRELLIEEPVAPARETAALPFHLGRSNESAAVGFSTRKLKPPRWRLSASAQTPYPTLELDFRSMGQKAQGLTVILSGPAIERELVKPRRLRSTTHSAAFQGAELPAYRAKLADFPLEQGVVYPFDPEPSDAAELSAARQALEATHFELELEFEARASGQDLLTISIFAADTSPPLRWTRPITVHAPTER